MTYILIRLNIYVIIAEQFVITNLFGRTSVRTLHVDCVWIVVSDSSLSLAAGQRCP